MRISDWSSDVCSSDLLAMIGGRAFGLQQGPYGDIVNAVGAAAGDEGDANDHKAYRRETDQQHGRAHDRGGSERSQADPAADDPFGQGRADQHSGGPQSGQHAERGRAAFQGHADKSEESRLGKECVTPGRIGEWATDEKKKKAKRAKR